MVSEVIFMRQKWTLGKKEKQAIRYAARGIPMYLAAKLVGVHRTTLWRWLKHPEAELYWAQQVYGYYEEI